MAEIGAYGCHGGCKSMLDVMADVRACVGCHDSSWSWKSVKAEVSACLCHG